MFLQSNDVFSFQCSMCSVFDAILFFFFFNSFLVSGPNYRFRFRCPFLTSTRVLFLHVFWSARLPSPSDQKKNKC